MSLCLVGCTPICTTCGQRKAPLGRSVPLEMYLCDHECAGYREAPLPCDLWPGERREDYGFPSYWRELVKPTEETP